MTRYTKTWRDNMFMGWDELSLEAKCTEATLAVDLGCKIPEYAIAIFQGLEPGQTYTTYDGIKYFREW